MKKCLVFAALVALTGCNSLPKELRREIADSDRKVEESEKLFDRTNSTIREDLSAAPELFQAAPAAGEWRSRLSAAQGRLEAAKSDRRELEKLDKAGRKEDVPRIRQLLRDEDRLQRSAVDEVTAIGTQANHWLDFQRNLPHYLAKMQDAHESAKTADFSGVAAMVARAQKDWPGKRADLESRLQYLKAAPERADQFWTASEAERAAASQGKASGAQIATLIQADEVIEGAARLPAASAELNALCGELYNSWDKILDDLDVRSQGADTVYREKIKTIKTRFTEAGDKSPQTRTDERWVDTNLAAYQAVENDLGMAISHKDAGLYDSEASNVAQPAGFAYIASPSVGSNQYGYWSHNEHGSFWTFLPQYLIMRELFWGNSYRPIVVNEYNGYSSAYRSGRTYYGAESPAAPPKYGSHGTFTQQRYASSRYVQSGGFKGSGFGSRQTPAASPGVQSSPRQSPGFGSTPSDNSQGKRFGRPAGQGAPPAAGKRFGGGPPAGKRFGGGGHRR